MRRFLKEKYLRIPGILIVAVFMALAYSTEEEPCGWTRIGIAAIFTVAIWQGAVAILWYFRKLFPNIEQTVKRLALTVITAVIYTFLIDAAVQTILAAFGLMEPCDWTTLWQKQSINVIPLLFVGTLYETTYFFDSWKRAIVEAEEYKSQQLRSQFEALKNQINPHFLFNSLNTLITLIGEDQRQATDFTQKLSEVYRYILQNKDEELITLRKELEFVRSYIFLLKMRFGNNLHVNIDIAEGNLNDHIAPLSLQMLIENAVKHNEVSNAHPLQIDLYVQNGKTIVVKNNLQKKASGHSTRIGLENIRKRYEYLSNTNIEVITTAINFMVALPLIKLVNETD
ncbi:MAG: histidine kinase [Bacteroidota bacterium]